MTQIEFSTDRILVNSPFVFKILNPRGFEILEAKVSSEDRVEGPVPLRREGKFLVGELSLARAGSYEMVVGPVREKFRVYPNEDLSFGIEFGGLAISVLVFLGVLIRWEQKRKKRKLEGGSI